MKLAASLLLVGCSGPLYDTTTHYGGEVSIAVAPVEAGVGLDIVSPGAPALENLGACKSYLSRQEPRVDIEPNRFLTMCIPSVPLTGPCFSLAAEVDFVVQNGRSLLWIRDDDAQELEADLGVIDGFVYEASGSLSQEIVLEGACLGDATAHNLEVTWAFTESETYPEGRTEPGPGPILGL